MIYLAVIGGIFDYSNLLIKPIFSVISKFDC